MNTVIMDVRTENEEAFIRASEILQNGGLVAFPTETVYGLGGDALNDSAAAKIYEAKGRPSDNPLIIHIADMEAVYNLADEVSVSARLLMETFWPGPLTVILKKKTCVPDSTTGGLDTVAIRYPSHPVARKLIKDSGIYIAAPSANLSGRPSPTTADHVRKDLSGRIDMILDGGPVDIGIESTIVDMTGEIPVILRPGFISSEMIKSVTSECVMDRALEETEGSARPKAPGMKYTHYAPKGELTIVEGERDAVKNVINRLLKEKKSFGYTTAVICDIADTAEYDCDNVFACGSRENDITVASALYRVLRECDEAGAQYIYSESFADGDMGYAIMNRLLKAAGHRIVKAGGN